MSNGKSFICLAKSIKTRGYCFAGKEYIGASGPGNWIRPISQRETEEIKETECECKNSTILRPLDIISFQYKRYKPNLFQCENILIDDGYYWNKIGTYPVDELETLCDKPDTLWALGHSTYYGSNDKVPSEIMEISSGSLYLIKAENVRIVVNREGRNFGDPSKKVRASFFYNRTNYALKVTDPDIKGKYLALDEGTYPLSSGSKAIYICVSLALPYTDGFCYKLAASILVVP
jgi:hypothetical protein